MDAQDATRARSAPCHDRCAGRRLALRGRPMFVRRCHFSWVIPARAILPLLLAGVSGAAGAAGSAGGLAVPELRNVVVDGLGADWGDDGLRVDILTSSDGQVRTPTDLDAQFRIAWDPSGLLLWIAVQDDEPIEHPELNEPWPRDSVDLVVAGATDRGFQLVISPGADPDFASARHALHDMRPEAARPAALRAEWKSRVVPGGYEVEVRLPWSNLGALGPKDVGEIRLRMSVDDEDKQGDRLRLSWPGGATAPVDPDLGQALRLATGNAGAPEVLRIDRDIRVNECTIRVLGPATLSGQAVEVRAKKETTVRAVLSATEARAAARLACPGAGHAEWPAVVVRVGGHVAAQLPALPALEAVLERSILAAGGVEALAANTSRIVEGVIHEQQRGIQIAVPFEARATAGMGWLLTRHDAGGDQQIGCADTVGWRLDHDNLVPDPAVCASPLTYLFDPQAPLRLADLAPGLSVVGLRDVEGREVVVVRTDPVPGARREVWVDPTGGARRELWFDHAEGHLMRISPDATLSDRKPVEHLILPHRASWAGAQGAGSPGSLSQGAGSLGAGSQAGAVLEIRNVRHDEPVDITLFALPDPATTFADAFLGIDDPRAVALLLSLPLSDPGGAVPFRDGRLLYDLILAGGYKRAVEIGTSSGYSAIWQGLALRKTGGTMVTLEIDPVRAVEARHNIDAAGLADIIEVRVGDALAEIPRLSPEFDFAFVDAVKTDYLRYFEGLRTKMLPGGAIAAHNALSRAEEMQPFLTTIMNDPQVTTTIRNASAEGMSVSVVKY